MSNWDGTERRKYPRVLTIDNVVVQNAEGGTELAQSVDLSRGGIRCRVPLPGFRAGQTVQVTLAIDNQNTLAVGQVTRAIQLTPLVQEIAIQFLELRDATVAKLDELGVGSAENELED